jgi:hypothetical protein
MAWRDEDEIREVESFANFTRGYRGLSTVTEGIVPSVQVNVLMYVSA